MNAMDVIVLPSNNEPFGITEIITSGVDGLLVHHDSAQEIANAVVDCLRRPDHARSLGAAARDRAKEFSTDRYVRALISALRELTAS
jgi:glycosyltransferase involved in cell wall biosynthesis